MSSIWHDMNPSRISAEDFVAVIEIEKGSKKKYELDKEPVRQEDITLPETFDSVYEEYNSLQKECGFDLSPYKGKNLKLYTYRLTNYPGEPEAMADVLVKGEKVVGGSVYSAALDGFMHGLRPVSEGENSSSNR